MALSAEDFMIVGRFVSLMASSMDEIQKQQAAKAVQVVRTFQENETRAAAEIRGLKETVASLQERLEETQSPDCEESGGS